MPGHYAVFLRFIERLYITCFPPLFQKAGGVQGQRPAGGKGAKPPERPPADAEHTPIHQYF